MHRSVNGRRGLRDILAGALTLCLAAAVAGCGSNRVKSDTAPVGAEAAMTDTLKGDVAIVGSEPLTEVVLRPEDGGVEVVLRGGLVSELRRVAGARIEAVGRDAGPAAARGANAAPGARVLEVGSFSVTSVNGVPAHDGILVFVGDVAYLESPGGVRTAIRYLPSALRGHEGARVWLSGRLDGGIEAFGVIREAEKR